jgi:stearoyl-CoA desaturase (delta-9 desaturase)
VISTLRRMRDNTAPAGAFIVAYHAALLVGLPFYFYFNRPSLSLVLGSVVLLFLTEIGIGAAYHRLYAHRAYSLSKPVEGVLLFLATLAVQGSVLQWACDHRLHHTFVDTDRDPYSIKKGFWYAHVLWLFEMAKPIDPKRVPDLLKNRLVMFQHQYYLRLSFGANILIWLLFGWLFSDFLGAFVLAWWTRLLISHHLTWFVNSLAHCWGERTFSKEQSAVDNYILAFLTVGEGYHNYHHTFAADYRNGVRWYHFDPVKWTVWTLSKLGLASNLRRFNSYTIKRRLLLEDRKLLYRWLKNSGNERKAELERKVRELADAIQQKIARMRALADETKKLKRREARPTRRAVRSEMKALKRSLRRDWDAWSRLGDVAWRDGAPSH